MEVGISGRELDDMMGIGGWAGGGVEQNADRRDKWGQATRNSFAVGMSCLRVNKESSLQARVPADCC